MKKTALITGSSNGIGLELARIHAAKGDNLILVARSTAKLTQLKYELESAYSISVYCISIDLSLPGSAKQVYEEVKQLQVHIQYLINNAGFGDFGLFHELNWEKQHQMMELNMTTLTHLTHLFVQDMVAQKSGKILNVASTAAFQPGPTMAVYFATKAYVLHFSEALNNELQPFGITVTALCPGATESGFQAAAAMQESKLVKGKKLPTSEAVAKYGYKAMMQGKAVAIPGLLNYLMANSVRFSPRSLVVKMVRFMQDN